MRRSEPAGGFGVGASLLRREDARHLNGRGQFVSDVKVAGTQDQGTESRLTAKRAQDLEQVLWVPRGSFSPSLDR